MRFYLAPLRGVTGRVFRNALAACFTSPDIAIAPFIPTFAGEKVRPMLLRDIDPALEQRIHVIPQVIGKDPTQLRTLLKAFKNLGYKEADLNAGCPWPFVTKKGRGCGLLAHPDVLESLLEIGCGEFPNNFSVKFRLGLKTPDLLAERMGLFNQYPLREITIHSRTAKQMYEGEVDLDSFEKVLPLCKHPVIYNGDINTYADWRRLSERFPSITCWMIGRGLAKNPALLESIHTGEDIPTDVGKLWRFHDIIYQQNAEELQGRSSILGRMKELWSYLSHAFPDGSTLWKQLRLCRTTDEYLFLIDAKKKRQHSSHSGTRKIC